jgi:hypothetical protein
VIVPLLLALLMQASDTSTVARQVDGRVVRGTRAGPVPLANQWVVLHRLTRDRSASGPLDSARTAPNGRFVFRYRATADSATMYFATTSFGGIVYPTAPFRSARVGEDDATLTVFDTTSGKVDIQLRARHVIFGAVRDDGLRPVGEVFDIENDSTVTAIARDSTTPVYSVHLPAGAANFRVNESGGFAAGAASRSGSTVGLYAPVSPGLRQFAISYDLPAKAFPVTIAMGAPVSVFELLIEDPMAEVRAPALREVAAENVEGRTFRRFLAQDLPADAAATVDVPKTPIADRTRVYFGVGITVVVAMLAALIYAMRRPRRVAVPPPAPVAPPPEPRSRVLARAIAELDEAFDPATTTADARAEYDERRARLKTQLSDALAAERSTK